MNRKLIEYLFREIVRVEGNIASVSKQRQQVQTEESNNILTIKLEHENKTLEMLDYIVDVYLNQFENET